MIDWTLTSGATTKSFALWGIGDVVRKRKSFATDMVTFTAMGRNIDLDPLFAQWSAVTIFDTAGKLWFTGIVTKVPLKGSGKAEDQMYTVSGPWWYFENLVFQQMWNILGPDNATLVPTLRSTLVINQNQGDNTKLDLGQVATLVINYVLTTAAASTPAFIPFQKGGMVPDTIIPFTEVSDLTCAQLMIQFFTWVPDAVMWFDYTTVNTDGNPLPTFNVSRRGSLDAVTLALFAGSVEAIDITPRADLVPPAVIVKYSQTNTVDGTPYLAVIPDIFPLGSPDPAFRNLVVNCDLLGGNQTYQKQTLTVTDRPKDYNAASGTGALSSVTLSWLSGKHRAHWLKSYTIPAGSAPNAQGDGSPGNSTSSDITTQIDDTKLAVLSVITTLVDNFTPVPPAAGLVLPSGNVPPGGGPGTNITTGGNALDFLGAELLEGTVPSWLTASQNIFSARVLISVTLKYTGDDALVQNWFGGSGDDYTITLSFPATVTNGASQEYSQLASELVPEAVPVGLAQNLYEGLSILHYEGQIQMTEQECSGTVMLGNALNLSGGRPEWTAMNAQAFEISESLDTGKTTLQIGPPRYLSAGQMVDLLRAARGRQQSIHLNERNDGKLTSANSTVQGAGTTSSISSPLPPGFARPKSFGILLQKNGSQWQGKVFKNSSLQKSQLVGDTVAISNLDTWTNIQAVDFFYLECAVTDGLPVSAMVASGSVGGTFDPSVDAWASTKNGPLADDGGTPPAQTFFRIKLADITSDANGNPIVTPWVVNNLQIFNVVINGRACIMAYPSNAFSL